MADSSKDHIHQKEFSLSHPDTKADPTSLWTEDNLSKENIELWQEYQDRIGAHAVFYCKSCMKHSSDLSDITNHVNSECKEVCSAPNTAVIKLVNTALTAIDKKQQTAEQSSEDKVVNSAGDAHFEHTHFCGRCPDTVMYSAVELAHHTRCHHGTIFTCCICRTAHGEWSEIRLHMHSAHNMDFQIHCSQCSLRFDGHIQFLLHYKSHRISCSYKHCVFTAVSQPDLDIHLRCHTTKKTFHCALCDYIDPHEQTKWVRVHTHIAAAHPGAMQPVYSCQWCGHGFQDLRKFRSHYRRCQSQVGEVKCKVCSKAVLVGEMLQHVETAHSIPAYRSPNNDIGSAPALSLPALSGENSYISSVIVDQVSLQHPPASNFSCSRHDMIFSSQMEFEEHIRQIHRKHATKEDMEAVQAEDGETTAAEGMESTGNAEIAIQNTVPGSTENVKVLPGATPVAKHQGRGRPVGSFNHVKKMKKFKCDICYRMLTSQEKLDKHNRNIHSEERMQPRECATCGKLFSTPVALRNHVRVIHEGVRARRVWPVARPSQRERRLRICDQCGYTTPNLTRLRNHVSAVHHGILPFTCIYCAYSTAEKSDLRRHMDRHQGVKRYSCQDCPYQTNFHWVLVNHCASQHSVTIPKRKHNTMGSAMSRKNQLYRERAQANDTTTNYVSFENVTEQMVQYVQEGDEMTAGTVTAVMNADGTEASFPTVVTMESSEVAGLMEQLGYDPGTELQVQEVVVGEHGLEGETIIIKQDTAQDSMMLLSVLPSGAETSAAVEHIIHTQDM